jgi:glucokinase
MLLAGDIGGTKTDLAVFQFGGDPRVPVAQRRFPSRDFPSLEAMAREYAAHVGLPITYASFAVAGPVAEGKASLTNLPWEIDASALQTALGVESVRLLNDIHAMATAVPHLWPSELRTLRTGEPVPGGAIVVIAPGTGLGEAFLTWNGSRYHAHSSEGGHVDFAPTTPREAELLKRLQARWGRVSYERVCAGQSIPGLYEFLKEGGHPPEAPEIRAELDRVQDRTPTIVAAGTRAQAPDPLCVETLEMFVSILGVAAGNLALTMFATGGIYLAGGIAQRVLPVATNFDHLFRSTFQEKGRLTPVLARTPIHLIVEPVALLGAALHGLDIIDAPGRVSA